jgi:hypothetical protein
MERNGRRAARTARTRNTPRRAAYARATIQTYRTQLKTFEPLCLLNPLHFGLAETGQDMSKRSQYASSPGWSSETDPLRLRASGAPDSTLVLSRVGWRSRHGARRRADRVAPRARISGTLKGDRRARCETIPRTSVGKIHKHTFRSPDPLPHRGGEGGLKGARARRDPTLPLTVSGASSAHRACRDTSRTAGWHQPRPGSSDSPSSREP